MKKIRVTNYDVILNHLQKHGSITALESARKYDILRLSAVILELRKNYNIVSKWESGKNRRGNPSSYVRYVLEK